MKAFTSRELARIVAGGNRRLSFAEQLDLAEFLADGVDCWESLQGLDSLRQRKKPWEPEADRISPLVAVLRRILYPEWSFYLPSSHLHLLRTVRLPSWQLLELLLEESIWRAGRELNNILSWLSTSCPGVLSVEFELIQLDPQPRIYRDCQIFYRVEDELGGQDFSLVRITMPTHIFSDGFELGKTTDWSFTEGGTL